MRWVDGSLISSAALVGQRKRLRAAFFCAQNAVLLLTHGFSSTNSVTPGSPAGRGRRAGGRCLLRQQEE